MADPSTILYTLHLGDGLIGELVAATAGQLLSLEDALSMLLSSFVSPSVLSSTFQQIHFHNQTNQFLPTLPSSNRFGSTPNNDNNSAGKVGFPTKTLLLFTGRSPKELITAVEEFISQNISLGQQLIIKNDNHENKSQPLYKLGAVVESISQLEEQLSTYAKANSATNGILDTTISSSFSFRYGSTTTPAKHSNTLSDGADNVVFLFTGQGSYYPSMGYHLYHSNPLFRQSMEYVDSLLLNILPPQYKQSMIEYLYISESKTQRTNERGENENTTSDTIMMQCCLFAIEYSLAQLWMKQYQVYPSIVIGHSIGNNLTFTPSLSFIANAYFLQSVSKYRRICCILYCRSNDPRYCVTYSRKESSVDGATW